MKNMKKLLALLLALTMLVGLLTACGGDDTAAPSGNQGETQDNEQTPDDTTPGTSNENKKTGVGGDMGGNGKSQAGVNNGQSAVGEDGGLGPFAASFSTTRSAILS